MPSCRSNRLKSSPEIFSRVTGVHHVAGTENPEAADKAARLHELKANIKLWIHFLLTGMTSKLWFKTAFN